MPLQVAVTVPPATTLAGVTVKTGVGVNAESPSATRILGFVTLPLGRVSVIGRPVLCRAEMIWSTVPDSAACGRIVPVAAPGGAASGSALARANPPPLVAEV